MKHLGLLLACLFAISCGHGFDYSDGNRSGTVVKFSRKGLFCKTWEGEMVLGGVTRNGKGAAVANVWDFTVDADRTDVISAMTKAIEEGSRVKATYHQGAMSGPCTGETGYFVTAVTVEP